MIASWQVDDPQDQLYGLSVWNLEPFERVGSHLDEAGARAPLHGYRLAWADQWKSACLRRRRGWRSGA